jgi:hypothetical protein
VSLFEPIFEALNASGVRYLVVGGLATVLHGFARLTADVDLVIDLSPDAALKGIEALSGLGFRPRVPVDARQFADPDVRRQWIAEKGMQVFTMIDPGNPMRAVDLFVESPFPFDELWRRSDIMMLGRIEVRVASIPDLIAMKRRADRPQDRLDIEALEAIARRRNDDGRRT